MGLSRTDLPLVDIKSWHGSTKGLLGHQPMAEQSYSDSLDAGYYRTALSLESASPEQVLTTLKASPLAFALRGRGGASFPTLTKIESVLKASRQLGSQVTLLANGAEGEPLSFKDRYLMRFRPHIVVDGAFIAAAATGASTIVFYVADDPSRVAIARAVAEVAANHGTLPEMRVLKAQETYVAGEETAAVRAVDTGVARPTDKPPRPFESGIGGGPTLVSNVESLAWLAHAMRSESKGSEPRFLATISGDRVEPRLYELPIGVRFGELQDAVTGDTNRPLNALMGGYFGGIIPMDPTLAMTYDALRGQGSSLGCGAVHILEPTTCPVRIAADVATFFAENNARQCLSCIYSTDTVAETLANLGTPQSGTRDALDQLSRWGHTLPGTGACAVPDGVSVLLRTLVRHFPEQMQRHVAVGCSQCHEAASRTPRRPLLLSSEPGRQINSTALEVAR